MVMTMSDVHVRETGQQERLAKASECRGGRKERKEVEFVNVVEK